MVLYLVLLALARATEFNGVYLYGTEPTLILDQPDNAVSIFMNGGVFQLAYEGFVVYSTDSKSLNSLQASNLVSQTLQVDQGIQLDSMKQWTLLSFEDFTSPVGWSDNRVSRCGINQMLGGYRLFSSGEVYKTYTGLPAHNSLKLQLTFHFIDAWAGEMAYIKADIGKYSDKVVIWSDTYKAGQASNSINVCGAHYGEGLFSVHVEVCIPHTSSSVKFTIGSTLDQDPGDESWGVSNMQVSFR